MFYVIKCLAVIYETNISNLLLFKLNVLPVGVTQILHFNSSVVGVRLPVCVRRNLGLSPCEICVPGWTPFVCSTDLTASVSMEEQEDEELLDVL